MAKASVRAGVRAMDGISVWVRERVWVRYCVGHGSVVGGLFLRRVP